MGGAPPPRLAAAKITHFLPQCNPKCTSSPTILSQHPSTRRNPPPGLVSPSFGRPVRGVLESERRRALRLTGTSVAGVPSRGVACGPYDRLHPQPRHHRRKEPSLPLPPAPVSRLIRRLHSPVPRGALATCAVLALAGCGSSSHSDGTEADPAVAVPAGTPLYLGATVRPSGSEQQGALAAGKELTGRPTPTCACSGRFRRPARRRSTSSGTSMAGWDRTWACSSAHSARPVC